MRIIYFDTFCGVSGDMSLGALIDAGVSPEALQTELAKLHLHGYSLEVNRVQRQGIGATDVHVALHEHHDHHHHHHDHHHGRHLPEILELIAESGIASAAKERATAIFRRLADAEAKVHGTTPDKIHFHEVGAVDAIVDIVGTCIGLSLLGIEAVYSSSLPMGHGFVNCAHGVIPIPPPAVVELTQGVPVYGVDVEGELVTPTGAAIVSALAKGFGPCPAMALESVGYGAGKSEFPGHPNLLRVMVGETAGGSDLGGDRVTVLEANIDDMNPEFYEYAMARLFEAGALDVFMAPIVMKKNRPATLLTVLAPPEKAAQLARKVIEETTTLGVRVSGAERFCSRREIRAVETSYGTIHVKVALLDGAALTFSPEYEDCKKAALAHGVPIKRVYEEAKKQALLVP